MHMRLIATILNALLLLGFLYIVFTFRGYWSVNEYWVAALVVAATVSSLVMLILGTNRTWLEFRVSRGPRTEPSRDGA
jgi:hypothetical protein